MRSGYETIDNALRRERGIKNRERHAVEDMSYGTDEEARRGHEYEANEAEEEGVEETQ